MKRFGMLLALAALGTALAASDPALAFRRGGFGGGHFSGFHGGGFAGRGFAGGGWGRGGWGGGGWGWNRGGGWNRGWGWNGGWWPAFAGLGLGLGYGLSAWDYGYPYDYAYGYGYPYDYGYGYGYPSYGAPYAATTAPLVTGRSVATGQMGNYCTTPVTTCQLYYASYAGNGCSCRISGGRSRGTVR